MTGCGNEAERIEQNRRNIAEAIQKELESIVRRKRRRLILAAAWILVVIVFVVKGVICSSGN